MKDNETRSYKRSFLIGMFLGDAFARSRSRHRLTAEWIIAHSEKQADLVEWKRDELDRLFGIGRPTLHRMVVGQYVRYRFSFTAGRMFRIVNQWFKRGGRKCITPKIRFMDHPVGLAMLLCDDGSVRKRKKYHRDGSMYFLKPSFTIATHCFSREEVERFLVHLSVVFGVDGIINPERRWRCGERRVYCRTHFNVENSRKLWKLVVPFIPPIPSMIAKFAFAYERFGR
jgi:hypothetical protein